MVRLLLSMPTRQQCLLAAKAWQATDTPLLLHLYPVWAFPTSVKRAFCSTVRVSK